VLALALPCAQNARWFLERGFDLMHYRNGAVRRVYALVTSAGTISATTMSSSCPPECGSRPTHPPAMAHHLLDDHMATTATIHTAEASRAANSSTSVETPAAWSAAFVDGHAIRAPTRCSSDA
jgi:hypothetical protein